MARFYLIRHADAYDGDDVQLDHYHLNDSGKVQAKQLAERLIYNNFDYMYCSRIQRSIDTCEIVNQYHKMDIKFDSRLNEVGSDSWPQPNIKTHAEGLKDFQERSEKVFDAFEDLCRKHPKGEVIVFTHGNWIKVVLSKILNSQNPQQTFSNFIISNSSLNIIDINESEGSKFPFIVTISDAAHTQMR